MNALIDNDLSDFQLKETDAGLELPRLVTCSRLGVIWDERGKSMVERKPPRQCTPDRPSPLPQPRAVPHRHRQLDRGLAQPQAAAHRDRLSHADAIRTAALGCINPRTAVEPLRSRFFQCCRGFEDVWHTHPMGAANEPRKTVLAQFSEDATVVDTTAGRVHVRWDETIPPPVLSAPESLLLLG